MAWLGETRRQRRRSAVEQWRKDWEAACAAPSRQQVEALRSRLNESSGPTTTATRFEREMLDGLEAVAELSATVSAYGLSPIPTGHRAVGHDRCFFSAPASLPDDPAQPSGTLLLTRRAPSSLAGRGRSPCPGTASHAACARSATCVLVRANQQDLHRLPLQQLRRRAARRVPRPGPVTRRRVIILAMSPTAPATRTVRAGIERLLDDDRALVAGSRVALVCNPASVDRRMRHSADLLRRRSRHRPGRRSSARSTASAPTCRTT